MEGLPATSSQIPWYRTRWFWGVIIGALVVWGFVFFFVLLPPADSPSDVVEYIFYASGAGFSGLLGVKLFGSSTGGTLLAILHSLLLVLLVYKTFSKPRVNILYPIVTIALFAFGSLVGVGYLSGL